MTSLKRLDLNLLIAFEAIYAAGNISHAARQLGISQPSVSNALARLRQLVGDPLFVAIPRGVAPTVRARHMIAPVREALGIIKAHLPGGDEIDPATLRRHFRVILADPFEAIVMPPLLRLMTDRAPGITIERMAGRGDFVEALRAGEVDLACYAFPYNAPDIVRVPISGGEIVAVSRRDHPRIGAVLDPETLASLGHVALIPELRDLGGTDADFTAHGIPRRIVCAVNRISSLAPLVERTDLICLMARWHARIFVETFAVALHELPFRMTQHYGYMMWHERAQQDAGNLWLRETMLRGLRAHPDLFESIPTRRMAERSAAARSRSRA